MNKIWTGREEQFIREMAAVLSDEEGAAQLSSMVGRKITKHAWRKKRQLMGLRKEPGRGICKLVNQDYLWRIPCLNQE